MKKIIFMVAMQFMMSNTSNAGQPELIAAIRQAYSRLMFFRAVPEPSIALVAQAFKFTDHGNLLDYSDDGLKTILEGHRNKLRSIQAMFFGNEHRTYQDLLASDLEEIERVLSEH